jgi:metallo-beta-lactamase class B
MKMKITLRALSAGTALLFLTLPSGTSQKKKAAPACSQCAVWSVPHAPFKIYGNTFYVGTHGLSSILINSGAGLVLIDGALQRTAPQIAANIKTLGFNITNVKLILNSHAHHDHAGGIAELQRMSGAEVVVSKWSAAVLLKGGVSKDDPQYGDIMGIQPVDLVRPLKDGEVIHFGVLTLTPHSTPGHTPGGTSWTWQSCEDNRCLNMVYADSVSAVSAEGYKYTQRRDPPGMQDFEQSFAFLDSVPCDILLTPHPEVSDLFGRLEKRNQGVPNAMIDPGACKTLEATGREALKKRIATETGH